MEEYRSPFQLPGTKCTNEHHAEIAIYSHSRAGTDKIADDRWGPKCPVHCIEKDDDPWLAWATYREAYATADGELTRHLFMTKMLNTVTAANPPDAEFDYGIWMMTGSTSTKIKTWYDIDGRPHRQEVNSRILTIHWVIAALATWIAVIITGITLLSAW